MQYEERLTVYIDIVGFKNIIDKTINIDGSDNLNEIENVIRINDTITSIFPSTKANEELNQNETIYYLPETIQITSFSDCLVISFLLGDFELLSILNDIKYLVINLIFEGILSRGAITFGKLIHTPTMVFGPSLVDAYLLEKDVAKYPRIILNDNVIEKITSANLLDIERLNTLITKDKDGNSYIDYFSKAVHELVDPPNEFPEYITILAQKIKHGIQSKNKDIRIKYEWMKEKYNILVEFCKSEDFLSKMPAKDTHEFYLGLHKIK